MEDFPESYSNNKDRGLDDIHSKLPLPGAGGALGVEGWSLNKIKNLKIKTRGISRISLQIKKEMNHTFYQIILEMPFKY